METIGRFGWSSKRVRAAYEAALRGKHDQIEFEAMEGEKMVPVIGRITRNKRNNVFHEHQHPDYRP